ncbi:MAG: hypothetical protein D6711_01780 [Chloroflexi bacterium]|nr:MAG: hypothetical protein D6711_01780 [Chloroflexota bacterium]
MRRLFVFLIFLLFIFPTLSQAAPDYRPTKVGDSYSPDLDAITVSYVIRNVGGTTTDNATATLTWVQANNTRTPLVNALVGPIAPDSVYSGEFVFIVGTLPRGEIINMQIEIRLPGTPNTPPITTSSELFSIRIPLLGESPTPAAPSSASDDGILSLPLIGLQIDTTDPTQVLILIGIIISGVLLLMIVWLMLRLLFQRTPSFGTWQPPYATMPPHDPNTIYGRRQLWQQHAQNNIIQIPCRDVQARKVLLGTNGQFLSGWKILAIRMTQYDMYGRVSRSEVLASRKMVKRLNRAAHKQLDDKKRQQWARPVAKYLSKQFKKKINARSAMLPIALDVRFQGHHGEVRIVFELYDCQQNYPHRLDQWEPEMTVIGKNIYESYTYTIFGQHGTENYKDFRRRLLADVESTLMQLLHLVTITPPKPNQPPIQPPPQTQPTPPPDTNPNLKAVQQSISDEESDLGDTVPHQSDR